MMQHYLGAYVLSCQWLITAFIYLIIQFIVVIPSLYDVTVVICGHLALPALLLC